MTKITTITCAFCKGRGIDPFGIPSELSKCQVCGGRKVNVVISPFEECPACLGTGVYKYHRLDCAVCKGRGQVSKVAGKDRTLDCKPGSREEEMLNIETGLPCPSAYDL